ncbi:hypothetical protein AVEN_248300-1 [Araneus ventricosus]|uniref:Histone-lysine N-methyltransferase SETMAR n=1 Tax=Araneus ventricosus TaxID=182803 RepID=A0A4Y2FIS3_ARAVE|nr:hypothetical protein AVEN_248300-1 [Araneus ventricosus]
MLILTAKANRQISSTSSEIVAYVNERVLANTRVTADEIAHKLDISHGIMHKIIVEHLEFRKICARWVPRLVTEHKAQQWLLEVGREFFT